MAPSHDRMLALDGIRGIAAVGVLLFHCGLHMNAPGFVGHGSLAVDIFFCMSGFVMERAYGARLRTGWPSASFARARLARLYPLYAAGLVLGTVLQLLVRCWQGRTVPVAVVGLEIAFGALLIPLMSEGPEQIFPLNGPSWSLFVEAWTNVGFVALPKRFGTPIIALQVALSGIVVIAAAFAGRELLHGGRTESLWLDLVRGGFGFGVGVLMSRLDRRQALGAVPRLPTPLVFASLAALLLVPRNPGDAWFDPVAIVLLCPALVALAVSSHPPPPGIGQWIARAGALSYPLYMVHAPILDATAKLVPEGSASSTMRALALGAAAAGAVALSAAICRWNGRGHARIAASRPSEGDPAVLTALRIRG